MIRTVLPLYYGPALPQVFQIVIHSVESGMTAGIGYSLATGWWQNPTNQSSVHGIADPADFTFMVPADQRAWHCGTGNNTSHGYEHSGRAAFTRDDWLTVDAVKMLNNSAKQTAKDATANGIPLRWLSVAEVRDNVKGFCTHNDMRLARGGTTHTDPGPNFPYALYMQLVQQWAGVPVGGTGNPNPKPDGPQSGGAESEETDMAFFFTYPTVDPGPDGRYTSRVFLSDGVIFRHIESMAELAQAINSLRALGARVKVVVDGHYAMVDAISADQVAGVPWAADPTVYGRDMAAS